MKPAASTALEYLGPLIFGDYALHLQQELILRGFANGPVEENQVHSTLFQLIDQQYLVDVATSQAIWRLHVETLHSAVAGGISQSLQRPDKPLCRAALYARVSSDQQAEAGTIESQVAALQEQMRRDGVGVDPELCFIDDGYSGSTLVRPAIMH
jgi:hypothetical protein